MSDQHCVVDQQAESPQSSNQALRLFAALAPVLFLVGLELARQTLLEDRMQLWQMYLLLGSTVLISSVLFAAWIFRYVGQTQQRLAVQNRELLTLHEAGLAITSDLDLEVVLQRVVDHARELVRARYAALSLYSEKDNSAEMFLTSGISAAQRQRLGPIPQQHGLLGLVKHDGTSIRVSDINTHPAAVGFPIGHPSMKTLLAVPIQSRGKVVGSLYVTERYEQTDFDDGDQARLERFATWAAVTIDNARLHRRVRGLAVAEERDRIAREMHDSLAQVLGYVNTKSQAVTELLKQGEIDRAEQHLDQLASAARSAYTDVRENILGLRTTVDAESTLLEALSSYLENWQDQSGIAVHFSPPDHTMALANLSQLIELQILRIIQEALTNVRKHAQATSVGVTIAASDQQLQITIDDNGVGFDPSILGRSDFPRFGLAIMRERAQAIAGNLYVGAGVGAGTRIIITVPIHQDAKIAQDVALS